MEEGRQADLYQMGVCILSGWGRQERIQEEGGILSWSPKGQGKRKEKKGSAYACFPYFCFEENTESHNYSTHWREEVGLEWKEFTVSLNGEEQSVF